MKIFREQFRVDDQCLNLAGLHRILSVAPARDCYAIDMWWVTDETPDTTHVDIYVMGTGHPMPKPALDITNSYIASRVDFLGTCVMSDGLVWHIFARVDG